MTLETFADSGELFLTRQTDVNPARPLFTGDVIENISIPGLIPDSLGIVIAHPCAMRGGAGLKDRILMAAVVAHESVSASQWQSGFFDRSPLPDLYSNGEMYVVLLDEIGKYPSADVDLGRRTACLSQFGINLIQHRLVHHLTRLVVPTRTLQEAFSYTYDEADLLEEWNETLGASGVPLSVATVRFDAFLQSPSGGTTLQKLLRDSQTRVTVRNACRKEARSQAAANVQ